MTVAAALEVVDVVKTYGALRALDGVSFAVDRGAVTALLGANGAGKTTLFQLLTGLFVADSGTIRVFGHDIRRTPTAALARLGIVFQQSALDLDLTAAQNLRFFAGLHGMDGRTTRDAARRALGQFGIADVAGKRVRELSGGTRRKVELARALVTGPDLLLLDEPSQGLDTHSRADLVRDVFALARDLHIAVLWATHLVAEVAAADRVVVLAKGRVVAAGTPAALLAEAGAATLEQAFLRLARSPGADAA